MSQLLNTRKHPSYWAFLVHRLSGLALACFLPVHLYVIGLAIESEAKLDTFLHWADSIPVKIAETLLVLLLAAHMTGGLRLLAMEFLPWHNRQKTVIALGGGTALMFALLFLLRAI